MTHNNDAALPHRKGLPKGHAEVRRELVVPVMRSEKITAIPGDGDNKTDYIEHDFKCITELADLKRDMAERKRTEDELKQMNEELEQREKERTNELETTPN